MTAASPPDPGIAAAPRRCGRCRHTFAGDPSHPGALPEWWLCPPCRAALLGPGA
jgi:hypothetical protein